jgi:hypothetical protein
MSKTSHGHIRLRCQPFGHSTQRNRRYEYFSGTVHRLVFYCVCEDQFQCSFVTALQSPSPDLQITF